MTDLPDPEREVFVLGDWHVDAAGNRLLRGSEVRPLRHKAMALLVLLARHPGRTVTRDEIVDAVWDGNRFVAPKAINTAVWALRQALGDDLDAPRYVETIAKKGYRLIAPVHRLPAPGAGEPAVKSGTEDDRVATPVETVGAKPAADTPVRSGRAAQMTALGLLLAAAVLLVALLGPSNPPSGLAALPQASPLTQNPGLEYVGRLSPDGRWLAFGWWQGQGDGRLYLRPAADLAAPPTLISGDAGDVQGLAWSPDGQALAFVATTGDGRCALWLARMADRSTRELAPCADLFTPTVDWSPDGRWIAFSAAAEGAGGLFLVAPDGSGLRRLTTAPPAAMPDHQPAWSPDGQRLAFVRQDPADGTRDLYEVTLDGRLQRLTQLRLYRWHGLTYADGGQDLIFSTTRQDARVLLRWDRRSGAVLPLGLEGSAPARAADGRLVYALLRSHVSLARLAFGTAAPERLPAAVTSDRSPDLHAASGRTVFVSRRSGPPELWLAGGTGDPQPRPLTRLGAEVALPAWSPAGDRVAFVGACGPGGRVGLCWVQAAGGEVHPVAADAAGYGAPAWHPAGRELWAASDRGGRWQLWRFAVGTGGDATPVATEQPPQDLQWSADGQALVYRPLHSHQLRWRPAAGGPERALPAADAGESLVDWRWGSQGLVVLVRGSHERFRRVDPASGRITELGRYALGTFPERARFTLDGPDAVRVEVANTAVADLMQAR
jgi:Tol biopolymer transport system component/DNA-binding winged helix-turn-helix (wHTH) protein